MIDEGHPTVGEQAQGVVEEETNQKRCRMYLAYHTESSSDDFPLLLAVWLNGAGWLGRLVGFVFVHVALSFCLVIKECGSDNNLRVRMSTDSATCKPRIGCSGFE